jgi:hypothetical protein
MVQKAVNFLEDEVIHVAHEVEDAAIGELRAIE